MNLEQAMINMNSGYSMRMKSFTGPEEIQNNMEHSPRNTKIQKANRQQYDQQVVNKFIETLTKLSLTLKLKVKKESRKQVCSNYMAKANKWLASLKDRPFFKQHQGVIIPFQQEKYKSNNNIIVRVIEDEVTVFNTKKRCPFRMVVETIDQNDVCKLKQMKSSKLNIPINSKLNKSNNNSTYSLKSDSDDFVIDQDQEVEEKFIKKTETSQKYNTKIQEFLQEANKEEGEILEQNIILNKNQQSSSIIPPTQEQKEKTALQIINQEKQNEKFNKGLRKFNILFPQKDLFHNTRRYSAHRYQKKQVNIEKNYYEEDQKISNKEKIQFFEDMKLYTPKDFIVDEIFQYLKLGWEGNQTCNKTVDEQTVRKFGPWGEIWEDKMNLIRSQSPYKDYQSYQIRPIIIKGGDDLRQELIIMQLIYKFQEIFNDANLQLWLKPYEIMVTSSTSGIIEFLPNTQSIDGLKKMMPGKSLYQIYKEQFQNEFEIAQKNFIQSLAAYCVTCYLLQIKDRHNGNILIDYEGHIIHIDFGFVFCISPGNMNFETAPFKLTNEYFEILQGDEDLINYFKELLTCGFYQISQRTNEIYQIIEIMMVESKWDCFQKFNLQQFKDRFNANQDHEFFKKQTETIVYQSLNNIRTNFYDKFQYYQNGIIR